MVNEKVVNAVQLMLLDEQDAVTPQLIRNTIEAVLKIRIAWRDGADIEKIEEELIRRFSVWVGKNSILSNNVDHKDWLSADRKQDWRYWNRYSLWLSSKMSPRAIDSLDDSTDSILSLLEDPKREGMWDRRGLVVGNVQSGKTGNYIGLINKAADAGYKIIIVLAGLHNNLRSQAQIRLDEGFLGYETAPNKPGKIIGVGNLEDNPELRPNYVTNRTDGGDFKSAIANNLGIRPESTPWLFVVKKNKTVLNSLYKWINNHVTDARDPITGDKRVSNLPLLVIDDESDQASVDTGLQEFDSEGKPDEEHNPTAINSIIRKILNIFTRSAYVGYTATPFANIFIHEQSSTREEGPDLFPSSFIINLSAPSNYVGPSKFFSTDTPLPLLHAVHDHDQWVPAKHTKAHKPRANTPEGIPHSLINAIDSFIIATCIRKCRGQGNQHSSMLIHVTRFNDVQNEIHYAIESYMKNLTSKVRMKIDSGRIISRLKAQWENDFCPTTVAMNNLGIDDGGICSWSDIVAVLPSVLADICVKKINGTAKDALDYVNNETNGLKVIAIGGDKLSRGLTLEGLVVSYFLRASKMYDTLMQMGRWFGYRQGYNDLTRLYTTQDLIDWFGHIAIAADELREEFDIMESIGGTPRDYGLKVKSHPVLAVTSRIKMRHSKKLNLSYSGNLCETVSLCNKYEDLLANYNVTKNLILSLENPDETNPKRIINGVQEEWNGYIWRNCESDKITSFLNGFKTHEESYKVNSKVLAKFISLMNEQNELTNWTVSIIGSKDGNPVEITSDVKPKMIVRNSDPLKLDRYAFGRLMSPRDEGIDLTENEWLAALQITRSAWKPDPDRNKNLTEPKVPNGPSIRRLRGFGNNEIAPKKELGSLYIYVIEDKSTNRIDDLPIVAFAISFPGSNAGIKVEYQVNNVLWEQDYAQNDR